MGGSHAAEQKLLGSQIRQERLRNTAGYCSTVSRRCLQREVWLGGERDEGRAGAMNRRRISMVIRHSSRMMT